jgi:secretion/DNA translocation related TadE-like protein
VTPPPVTPPPVTPPPVTPPPTTPPARDDIWTGRRRLGDVLRRWAGAPPAHRKSFDSPRCKQDSSRQEQDSSRREENVRQWRRSRWWARTRRDRGAATVFVLAIGLVLVAAGGAGAAVGAARVGRHQAQLAADLGALAGAARAIEGQATACAEAARFVAANAGRMSSCEVQGLEIVVQADVDVTGLPGPARHARAAACAGPVYAI